SIPVNLLATLAAAPVVVLSLAAAAAAAVWLPAGERAARAAAVPARWRVWLAETGAAGPGGVLRWRAGGGWGIRAGLVLAVGIGPRHVRGLRRPLLAVFAAAALGSVPACLVAGGPPSGWVVTMCDVGQGDALVLPAGDAVVVV